ncbi:hypothetical protein GCM10010503_56530 [Streptomyces lucensis JCM 4490]|uniref:Uncharacterized protein n=1 Tax=Streptomyces lucensis JCM 4490 TaxID=1306176 RepID=A0A918JBE4_9ACTN|nr:hypothetical protein GCM10010503_56530 [Streptomyces lucensis JCM 4490]
MPEDSLRLDGAPHGDVSFPGREMVRGGGKGDARTADVAEGHVRTLTTSHLKWLVDPAPAARALAETAALLPAGS